MPPTVSMSLEELHALPATVPFAIAARAFSLGRTKANEMARQGTFPCQILTLGQRRIVTRHALFAALGIDKPSEESGTATVTPESPGSHVSASQPAQPAKTAELPSYVVIAVPASPAILDALLVTIRGSGARNIASHF